MTNLNELIIAACNDKLPELSTANNKKEWAVFGLHIGIKLYEMLRAERLSYGDIKVIEKSDGSPTTELELEMERYASGALSRFYPKAEFVGEESGRALESKEKILLAIDPIDGTRSFLSGFDSYSITLSITSKGKPIFSLIIVPATGMFACRIGNQQSEMFYFDADSDEQITVSLPHRLYDSEAPLLINVHPSIDALSYLERVYDLWYNAQVSLIRSVSGSPSLFMLEAARTGTYYLNTWSKAAAEPFDLMAAFHIVDGARYKSVNLDGSQIDPWSHKGAYMVGPDSPKLQWLLGFMPDDKLLY